MHLEFELRTCTKGTTPLTTTRKEIFNQMEGQSVLKRPNLIRSNPYKWDHGHDADDCIELKDKIENLIYRGQLRQFVVCPKGHQRHPAKQSRPHPPHEASPHQPALVQPPVQDIYGIIRVPRQSGTSNRSHKQHVQAVC